LFQKSASFSVYQLAKETLQNRPGSKLITTRRFTHQWQDEIPGITELVGEGWIGFHGFALARSLYSGAGLGLLARVPAAAKDIISIRPVTVRQQWPRRGQISFLSAGQSAELTATRIWLHGAIGLTSGVHGDS
jgi:hypothetical protein